MHPDNRGQQFKVHMMPMSVVGEAYSEYGDMQAKDLTHEDLRSHDNYGENYNFKGLLDSVSKHGVKEPIQVSYDDEEHEYHLLNGHHRFVAAKLSGQTHIPVELHPMYHGGSLPKEYS